MLARVERLLASNDYQAICDLLGPTSKAKKRSPVLVVLYATAHKELDLEDPDNEVNFMAIRAVARLLGVDGDSRTALMLAKRMLRTNPSALRERSLPRAPARVAMIILGLLVGACVGWALGPGNVQLIEIINAVFR